jgi:methylated-DNA-[protein]-cysteine S-methyltransferase
MNAYQIVKTSFGPAAVAFCDQPFRLLEVRLPSSSLDDLCQPFEQRGWQIDPRHPDAAAMAKRLAHYFDGGRIDIPWPVMDLSRFTTSQQAVYRAVATIPYGSTASYKQVARMVGLPQAARFVGTTMAKNAYPVFIPCHRVIKSDGSLGGFSGGIHGTDLKRRMLALEASSESSP